MFTMFTVKGALRASLGVHRVSNFGMAYQLAVGDIGCLWTFTKLVASFAGLAGYSRFSYGATHSRKDTYSLEIGSVAYLLTNVSKLSKKETIFRIQLRMFSPRAGLTPAQKEEKPHV